MRWDLGFRVLGSRCSYTRFEIEKGLSVKTRSIRSCGLLISVVNLGGAGLMAAVYEQDVCVWRVLPVSVAASRSAPIQEGELPGFMFLCVRSISTAYQEYGNYGVPPRWSACLSQGFSWLGFCFLMKIAATLFMLALQVFLGSLVLAALDPYPKAKLTVVMVATPLLMNSLQYWLTDNFIKKREAPNREIPVYNVVQTTEDLTPTVDRKPAGALLAP
ncbi:hypothetical protein ACSSS7_000954 [Eimeria intestinalis]